MKKVLVLIFACLASTVMFAQEFYYQKDWTGCEAMNTKINGVLTIDGVEVYNGEGMQNAGGEFLEIGVFDQDEICRGTKFATWRAKSNQWIYQLQFRGVQGYSVYHFKVYDHASGTELDLVDDFGEVITYQGNYTYQWNGSNSSPTNPYHINFTHPNAETLTLHIDGYNNDGTNEDGLNAEGKPYRYYLIASPKDGVTPGEIAGMTEGNFDLYSFDQVGDGEGNEWITNVTTLESGTGYLYAHDTDVDLEFNGPFNTEATVDLVYNEDAGNWAGWNLVGNPLGVPAYIEGEYYVMNEEGTEIEPGSGAIQPMQGLFVLATGEGTLTFTPEQGGKTSKRLNLNLSNSRTVVDRAAVSFSEGSRLPKIQLHKSSTKVYIPMDDQDYAVVTSEGMGELPVNFKAEFNGNYNLSFTTENVEFAYLHLIDNLTGNEVDLLANPSYSFEASTTDYASRFKLVFATGDADDTFAFFSNGSFVINNEGNATLQVIDVTGRILSSETINGCANVNVNAANGVYMLRLVNGDNVKTQKVVVR